MLQMIFGDDEHTSEDGPYKRLMKTRKWLYLAATFGVFITAELYDPAAFKALFKIASAPYAIVRPAASIALLYMMLQYVLLLGQLSTTYDLVLIDRFRSRQIDEIAAAQTQLRDARLQVAEMEHQFSQPINRDEDLAFVGKSIFDQDALEETIKRKQRGDLHAAEQHAILAEGRLAATLKTEPAERPFYKIFEVLIDAARLLPPLLFAGSVLYHLI